MTNNIEVYRKAKGLSQRQLAKLIGVSAGYLYHLENGSRSNPSKKVMDNIAMALNKTITEVFLV